MATQYSELEQAILTLVSEFHNAADGGATMSSTQFQSMISSQLPEFSKQVETEEGLGKVLDQMGVKGGQSISFQNFWTLINKQAIQVFNTTDREKDRKDCGCLLQ